MSWSIVELGDLAEFRNGINYNQNNFGTGIKVIGVVNFKNYIMPRYKELEEVNPEGVVKDEDILQNNDILFVRSNGNKDLIGRSLFIESPPEQITFSGFCIRTRFTSNQAFPRFFAYLFRSDLIRKTLSAYGGGTNIANLNQKILSRLQVPLPPVATQQRIADILSTYDRFIDNNNRRIALLEESIHQLYKEWFVRSRFPGYESMKVVDGIPEGWKVSSIGNLSEVITRGITPKYDSESKNIVLNQKCIRNYQINFEFARQHHSQVSEHKKIRFGDVLINSTGIGTLGRVAQVLANCEDLTVDTHITIVRPKVELEKHFFGVALENLQDYFDTLGEGATGQTELKRQLLSVVPILLPNENLRKYFDEKASVARLLVPKLLEQNQKLKEARDLLLPRLMNGSIAV
ncbi:hypothetical protein CDG76_09050 [Nostoc sp. 'Peltigera membranacea cyanobiont' 210A]|uniref:restriction endonuclease subunit S n=1 Tax=Nostoc sp. 'Peltigera membranacea cyanobiont' 210A TaxID=2014529 RepID=UPI000B958958|nr:restriction endonuclease subunit S [Nostoc sp. 'Peltigera membranacea cyanobiont' 210A]OYD96889.1 hypothetical protein CDG76_09050 [Nostoc sp. 'Peltigera membranacea cyanobiont' 210A]